VQKRDLEAANTRMSGQDPGRRVNGLAVLAVPALLASLVVHAPAQWALDLAGIEPERARASGTIWRGQAVIPQVGVAVWTLDPLRSVMGLALAGKASLSAVGLEAEARVSVRPGRVDMRALQASAEWSWVETLPLGLDVSCDTRLTVSGEELSWRRDRLMVVAEGQTEAGHCKSGSGTGPFSVPETRFTATSEAKTVRFSAYPSGSPGIVLLEGDVDAAGVVRVRITEDGQALKPDARPIGPVELEIRPACMDGISPAGVTRAGC
jgi:hypothetical protein